MRPLSSQGALAKRQISASKRQFSFDNTNKILDSTRRGVALALYGSQLAEMMSPFGWYSTPTASYYLKLAQVLRPGGSSESLSAKDTEIHSAAAEYDDFNNLRNFVAVFPLWLTEVPYSVAFDKVYKKIKQPLELSGTSPDYRNVVSIRYISADV